MKNPGSAAKTACELRRRSKRVISRCYYQYLLSLNNQLLHDITLCCSHFYQVVTIR